MKRILLFFTPLMMFCSLKAQISNPRAPIIVTDSLKQHDPKLAAIGLGLPFIIRNSDGVICEFQGFYPDGIPLYYQPHNRDAAKTVSTSKLWQGGGLGLDLSGNGMIIGEWDGGKTRLTHQEFDGRAFQMDGATDLSDHATHVGVTLVGKGVETLARGMAYKATLNAYDWNSDESEMELAAQNGLLVSNHSYGNITGWYKNTTEKRWEWYGDTTINANEDWKYGFYSAQSREWDAIAFDNPDYLIVKSAGNDRDKQKDQDSLYHYVWSNSAGAWVKSSSQRGAIGPYDCISGAGLSKNILTVGAVDAIPAGYNQPSDVVMSTFSSWGPTDDGRIKPDICGNGVGVYSGIATGDDKYATYNGTSMAGPNVAGSLLLVQEHYKNVKGTYMLAATLKGLVIHTADEAGSAPGPDYSYGWGLLNSAKAVQVISGSDGNRILQNNLQNNSSYELIIYSDGTKPLKGTVIWSDKEASVSQPSMNPTTLKLVNDLDMRIEKISDATVFEPWILDPANRTAAATKGDNFRDNVEQVLVDNPSAGFYKIKITHKGSLSGGSQKYSLLLSGEAPGLKADFTLPSAKICANSFFVLTPAVFGSPTGYEWTVNGQKYTDSAPRLLLSNAGSYDVKLKIYNPATSDSIVKIGVLEIYALPSVVMTPVVGSFCSNDGSVITLSSAPAAIFQGPGVTGTSFTASTAGAGIHTIYANYTDNNGCKNYDSSVVEVKAAPAVPVITADNKDLVSSAAPHYQWFIGGNLMTDDTLQRITPVVSGRYTVEVTNDENCRESSLDYDFYMQSVKLVNGFGRIYPNPVKDELTLEFTQQVQRVEVRILDAKGALIKTISAEDAAELKISIPAHVSTLIFVQITANGQTHTYPVVVDRK